MDTEELNTTNKQDPVDTYRTLYPTTAEYTFFSVAHRTYSKVDHILGHLKQNKTNNIKKNLNRFKIVKISQSMFFKHSGIKPNINNRKIIGKSSNT